MNGMMVLLRLESVSENLKTCPVDIWTWLHLLSILLWKGEKRKYVCIQQMLLEGGESVYLSLSPQSAVLPHLCGNEFDEYSWDGAAGSM